MNTFQKAKLTTSVHHIKIFSKLRILIYNFEVPDVASRKTRKRTQAIAKRFPFHTYAIIA